MVSLQREIGTNVCASMTKIEYDKESNKITGFYMLGGCYGLAQVIRKFIDQFKPSPQTLCALLEGVKCSRKGTSCANEVANIIKKEIIK